MSKDKIIDNVKAIKGINDDLQDDLLGILYDESLARILAHINAKRADNLEELPSELDYILQDVTVVRFNRLNSEGTKQNSEEGQAFTWQEDYLENHFDVLRRYQDSDSTVPRQGRIAFY